MWFVFVNVALLVSMAILVKANVFFTCVEFSVFLTAPSVFLGA